MGRRPGLAVTLATPALAGEGDEDVEAKGLWAAVPTREDNLAALPALVRAGKGGRGVVRCHVEDSGALSDCVVLRETPAGAGVGQAVLSLAPKYRRKPPGSGGPREAIIARDWFRVDAPTNWLRKPTSDQLIGLYPRAAKGAAGTAIVDCLVTTQGTLNDCVVFSEKPVGLGFGAAAVALTLQFTMKPVTYQGAPTQTTVRIPIHWPAGAASTSGPGSKRVVPANLSWAEAPSFADVAAAYPKKAREESKSGHAVLSCDMNEEGRLVRCAAGRVDPGGYGFETAAKELAKRFRLNVQTPEDKKLTHGLAVHLPVTFDAAILNLASPVVGKPTWVTIPSASQTGAAFGQLKVTGTARVSLACVVQPGGTVSGCAVASESPAGTGLGAAALSLVPAFRVSTWTTEGLPVVGGTIGIPLRYEGEEATPAAPPAPK